MLQLENLYNKFCRFYVRPWLLLNSFLSVVLNTFLCYNLLLPDPDCEALMSRVIQSGFSVSGARCLQIINRSESAMTRHFPITQPIINI